MKWDASRVWAPRIAWAWMAFAVAAQAFFPPIVGTADNADYGSVIGPLGMAGPPADHHKFLVPRYPLNSPDAWHDPPFQSTERVLVWAAVRLNRLVTSEPWFDIRFMGGVHAALYLGLWGLILPRLGWLAIPAAVMFSDVMYASLMNSFHMDVAALLGLLALVATHGMPATGIWIVLSKTQHAPLAVVLAGAALLGSKRWRWLAAATVSACGAYMLWTTAPGYARIASYNVTYYRLLPGSKDVAADLAGLGLDDRVRRYIGTYAYQPHGGLDDPAAAVTHARLARYYLMHPAAAWRDLTVAMQEAARLRHAVGNFTRESGKPELAESTSFAWWSDLKRAVFEPSGVRFAVSSLLLMSAAAAYSVVARSLLPGLLAAMALVEMIVSGMADTLEVARHLFLFHAMWDLMLILLLGEVAVQRKDPITDLPAREGVSRRTS